MAQTKPGPRWQPKYVMSGKPIKGNHKYRRALSRNSLIAKEPKKYNK